MTLLNNNITATLCTCCLLASSNIWAYSLEPLEEDALDESKSTPTMECSMSNVGTFPAPGLYVLLDGVGFGKCEWKSGVHIKPGKHSDSTCTLQLKCDGTEDNEDKHVTYSKQDHPTKYQHCMTANTAIRDATDVIGTYFVYCTGDGLVAND